MAVETFENEESNASVREKLNDTITAVQMLMQAGGGGGVIPFNLIYTGNWIRPTTVFSVPAGAAIQFPSEASTSALGSWIQDFYLYEDNNDDGVTSLLFENLAGVIQDLELDNPRQVTSIYFPLLAVVGSDLYFYGLNQCTELQLDSLKLVGSDFRVDDSPLLTELNLPELEAVGRFELGHCDTLSSLSVPKLKNLENLYFNDIALTSINFPELLYVAGGIEMSSMSELTSLTFSKLETIDRFIFTYNMENLTSFSYGTELKKVYGDQYFNSTSLNEESVDHIVTTLAGLDGTNGTSIWGDRALELANQNSPISLGSLDAISKLIGRNISVNVNYPTEAVLNVTVGDIGEGVLGYIKSPQVGSVVTTPFSPKLLSVTSDGANFVLSLEDSEAMNSFLNSKHLWIDDEQVDGNFESDGDTFTFVLNPEADVPVLVFGQTYEIKIAEFT